MVEEPASPEVEELEAAFRSILPDGTDWVHVAGDDAAWASFSQALTVLVAPDFVYEDSVLPDHAGETYRGIDGLRRAASGFAEPYEEMIYYLKRIALAADGLVAIYRVRAKARKTGISFDLQWAYLYRYRDGKIVSIQAFLDPDDALEAVGLQE